VHALDGRADGADVLDRFNQLGTVQRDADGSWRSAVAA
jgi:hypothetical protein